MNAKQEILDALTGASANLKDDLLVLAQLELDLIRAILETHELVPVDTRPFDPALCGFKRVDVGYVLIQPDTVSDVWITPFDQTGLMDISCESGSWVCPWPATQSDGETLLRLLGVINEAQDGII